jgi:hypothetical protein
MKLNHFTKDVLLELKYFYEESFFRFTNIKYDKFKLLHSLYCDKKERYNYNDNYLIELCKINLENTIIHFEKDSKSWVTQIKLEKLRVLSKIFDESPKIIINYYNRKRLTWDCFQNIEKEHAESFINKTKTESKSVENYKIKESFDAEPTKEQVLETVKKWIKSKNFFKWQLVIIGSVLFDLDILNKTKDDRIPERLRDWGKVINMELSYNNRIAKTFDIGDPIPDQKKLKLLLIDLLEQFESIFYIEGIKKINESIKEIDKKLSK